MNACSPDQPKSTNYFFEILVRQLGQLFGESDPVAFAGFVQYAGCLQSTWGRAASAHDIFSFLG
ncbi:MAG: hypothetical protein WCT54_01870 [Patescibacteria group bacterium]